MGWLLGPGLSKPLPTTTSTFYTRALFTPPWLPSSGCPPGGCGGVSCIDSCWGKMDPVARTSQGGQESRRGLESIPGRGGTQDKQPPAPPTHTPPKASSQPPRLCLSVGFKSTGDMYNPIISPCPTACFWGPAGHTRALQEASRGDRTSEGGERARQEGDTGRKGYNAGPGTQPCHLRLGA